MTKFDFNKLVSAEHIDKREFSKEEDLFSMEMVAISKDFMKTINEYLKKINLNPHTDESVYKHYLIILEAFRSMIAVQKKRNDFPFTPVMDELGTELQMFYDRFNR